MPRKRVVEQTVFKFEELSERAKDTVRYWVNDNSLDWWDSIYDDFKQVAACFGFEIETKARTTSRGHVVHDDCIWFEQRYGWTAGFNARFRLLDAIKAEEKVKDYASQDEVLIKMARVLEVDIAKFAIVGLKHIIEQGDVWMDVRGDERGMSKDCTLIWNDSNDEDSLTDVQQQAATALEATVQETAVDLARWLAKQLEAENDYRHSDEAVQEHCEANDYEFYEDGSIA